MHAFLIIGPSEDYLKKITSKKLFFPLQKIADARELNRFTRLTLTEKTAIVISDFDQASEETQNAFLKALEEPQENLTYILTATNIENILETIVSRSEVIQTNVSYQAKKEEFTNGNIGEKFLIASKIIKREDAIEFIKNIIIVGHESMENIKMLESALLTLKNLEANGNVTLQLTNFVLNLDSL